jgi:hypothetical protein
MTDQVCPRCRRPIAKRSNIVGNMCGGGFACDIATAAYRRGLRDGADVAKRELVMKDIGKGHQPYEVPDWTDVDAEIERLTK